MIKYIAASRIHAACQPSEFERFYAMLFSKYPEMRGMFPQNLHEQKKKLFAALLLVIRNLREPSALIEPLQQMGGRHTDYGAEPDHYPIFRDVLVSVMADMAGDEWNDQLQAEWSAPVRHRQPEPSLVRAL